MTEERNSVSDSETTVNLATNDTGTVTYDQTEAQEHAIDEAKAEETEATTALATTDVTKVTAALATKQVVNNVTKEAADKVGAVQEKTVTEAAAVLATKQVADKAVVVQEKATAEATSALVVCSRQGRRSEKGRRGNSTSSERGSKQDSR